ncbi:hypothetical protein ABW19_dt0202970 [Dactylella cylindrospora]|nr:hypothetical protein ABW19_dt0202970 [Dactylella cylindrospora]
MKRWFKRVTGKDGDHHKHSRKTNAQQCLIPRGQGIRPGRQPDDGVDEAPAMPPHNPQVPPQPPNSYAADYPPAATPVFPANFPEGNYHLGHTGSFSSERLVYRPDQLFAPEADAVGERVRMSHESYDNSVAVSPPPAATQIPYPTWQPYSLPDTAPATAGDEDKFTMLADFDTVLVIDDSLSMKGDRWQLVTDALSAIIPIVTHYDRNGVDIYFLNRPHDANAHEQVKSKEQVLRIFDAVQPEGTHTPTGRVLKKILDSYIRKYNLDRRIKKLNIIVITDGEPTDDVEGPITDTAKNLDNIGADYNQVGIQFVQIGNDKEAAKALMFLDNDLSKSYNVRDMVDTVIWAEGMSVDDLKKVVLGGVHKGLDRKTSKAT